MFKLVLEKAEEPEIKLPTSAADAFPGINLDVESPTASLVYHLTGTVRSEPQHQGKW